MTTSSKSNREKKAELPGWGLEDSLKTLAKQPKLLTILFENKAMKAKTKTQLILDCMDELK